MKIGIFGSHNDPQSQLLISALKRRSAEVALVESTSIHTGTEFSYRNGSFFYNGERLDDVAGWFLRYVISPLPPRFKAGEDFVLYQDWFYEYMHRQERYTFQIAMLLAWGARGIPVVNPPENGGVMQIKTFQLDIARLSGLDIPRTLVTNNKEKVAQFKQEVGEVVFKPSMGGALCTPLDEEAEKELDLLRQSPVIFQERVKGTPVRVTMVGDQVVSCARIPSSRLDYRDNPGYNEGKQVYLPEFLPETIRLKCLEMMKNCGLLFSGIDFILQEDGRWVFLEANSSPIYLDIERKTGVSITDAIADHLLLLANDPERYRQAVQQAARTRSFVKYAMG